MQGGGGYDRLRFTFCRVVVRRRRAGRDRCRRGEIHRRVGAHHDLAQRHPFYPDAVGTYGAQEFVQQKIAGWLWDPVIQWLLLLPTWAVLGLFGFLLTYLGRRRRVRIAYA